MIIRSLIILHEIGLIIILNNHLSIKSNNNNNNQTNNQTNNQLNNQLNPKLINETNYCYLLSNIQTIQNIYNKKDKITNNPVLIIGQKLRNCVLNPFEIIHSNKLNN